MPKAANLTDNERATLVRCARGETAKQIAWKFNVSPRTIECRVYAIRKKLGAHSMPHAVALAFIAGVLKKSDIVKARRNA